MVNRNDIQRMIAGARDDRRATEHERRVIARIERKVAERRRTLNRRRERYGKHAIQGRIG